MPIPNKLKIVGIVPIVFLVLLSGYFFVTSYLNFEKANALKTILNNNATLSNTLVQISKERGLTSLYLGSAGKEFSDSLIKQRASTDQSFKSLKQELVLDDISYIPVLLKLLDQSDSIHTDQYDKLLNNLSSISVLRKSVDAQSKDFKKIFFDGYTQKFATPTLDSIAQVKNFALNTDISSLISSLLQLSIAKENAGLEREFISYYMTKRFSMSPEEITLWDQFKTKANAFDIKQISDNDLRTELGKIFNDPKAKEMLTELRETSLAMQTDVNNGNYAEDPIEWFTLQTKKISLLSKAELMTSSVLWKKSGAYLQEQLILLSIASFILLMSFILAFLAYHTIKDISRNIKKLEDSLNKAVDDMKNNEEDLTSDTANIEHNEDEEVIQEPEEENRTADIELVRNDSSEIARDEPSEKIILIAKKFLIEKKVLTKVIENLKYDYSILDNIDLLENELASANYDVLFTDKDLITDSISKSIDNLLIITSVNSKEEIEALINTHRG